jgi:hypothetical protein
MDELIRLFPCLVVVCWSNASVHAEQVQSVALMASAEGKLFSVLLDPVISQVRPSFADLVASLVDWW